MIQFVHLCCALTSYHHHRDRDRGAESRKAGVKEEQGGLKNEDEENEEEEAEVKRSRLLSDLSYVQLHPEVRDASKCGT